MGELFFKVKLHPKMVQTLTYSLMGSLYMSNDLSLVAWKWARYTSIWSLLGEAMPTDFRGQLHFLGALAL
jgi:hypothetical protein